MYYPDHSLADSAPGKKSRRKFHVGWLDAEHPFPTGAVPSQFVERLLPLCAKSKKTRGIHFCDLCADQTEAKRFAYKNKTVILGSGECLVRGRNWKTYTVPDLIYHYVVDHGYKPPGEFIEAVLHPRSWFLTPDFLGVVLISSATAILISAATGYRNLILLFSVPLVICALVPIGLGIANIFRAKNNVLKPQSVIKTPK